MLKAHRIIDIFFDTRCNPRIPQGWSGETLYRKHLWEILCQMAFSERVLLYGYVLSRSHIPKLLDRYHVHWLRILWLSNAAPFIVYRTKICVHWHTILGCRNLKCNLNSNIFRPFLIFDLWYIAPIPFQQGNIGYEERLTFSKFVAFQISAMKTFVFHFMNVKSSQVWTSWRKHTCKSLAISSRKMNKNHLDIHVKP